MVDYRSILKEYQDSVYAFAVLVYEGKIKTCKKELDACIRHLNDLLKISKTNWKYDYDTGEAQKAIDFIELLPDVKTGETYPLGGFQKFIVGSLYGWRKKSNSEFRRFRKAFISMARKSGKTILIAGILLYEFLFGKNPAMSRQLFCTANDRKQSKIAFDMARKQLDALRAKYPEIRKATKKTRDELYNLNDESYITYLSKETGAVDGFEPYVGVFDEYAASKTTEMMELIESGQGQLKNSLILIISTAGFNLNAPMHSIEYPRCADILEGKVDDEEYFIFIAEQESLEEIEDETNWIKSNPILEVESLNDTIMEYLRKRWKVAKETGAINKVLVKNFNMWRQANEESYMDTETWSNAKIEEKPSIRKRRTWIGIDVGRSSDLFSISWLTMMDDYWFADSFSFVATKYGLQSKEKRDGVSYTNLTYRNECEITQLESGVIDDERVMEWLERFVYDSAIELQGIYYDPYQFGTLLTMIEKRHPEWKLIEVPQKTMVLNMPTKQFRDDVKNGKIKHANNTLLTMAVNNAFLKSDQNGVRIDKNRNSNKIDPLDALLNPYAVCYLEPFDGFGYWTDEKIKGSESIF